MSEDEALTYVDWLCDRLLDLGILTADQYGRMTENQRHALAEGLAEKSEE